MEIISSLDSGWFSLAQIFASFVLVWVTIILARATKKLADAATEPYVVVNFEPSKRSIKFFNLVIENTGAGPAFDVVWSFEPNLVIETNISGGGTRPELSKRIGLIRPKQKIESFLTRDSKMPKDDFKVTVSWRKRPGLPRETIKYRFSVKSYWNMAGLGLENPLYDISGNVQKITQSLERISRNGRIQVDTHTKEDRSAEWDSEINQLDEDKED